MNFFEKSEKNMEEIKMQNDFRNWDFWVEKDQFNNKKYYMKINGEWIEISKEVYSVYKRSYQKMYRVLKKESDSVDYYGDIEILAESCVNQDLIEEIVLNDKKRLLHKIMKNLSDEELFLIKSIYFDDMKEKELAEKLNVSQQLIHYRKKKILKRLKIYLLDSI